MIAVLAFIFLLDAIFDPEPTSKWWIGFLFLVLIWSVSSLGRKWR